MKHHARLASTILLFILSNILTSYSPLHAMGTDLIWTVVTTEDDSGPGSLREAINMINAVGSGTGIAPNAIAFAQNVSTIQLESPLPTIQAPVLIDGLALVSNGSVIQEGNCDILPSPADDPCAFSASLRVTIDGSTIPLLTSPSFRAGLEVVSDNVIIRGINIINITTPAPDSVAVGIAMTTTSDSIIECCEINTIRNTAGSSDGFTSNLAAGINGEQYDVNKTYIHNIHGGLISRNCESIPDNTQLVGGAAYGIRGLVRVVDSRIEQVKSGSILACIPDPSGSQVTIELTIRTAVGISAENIAKNIPQKNTECTLCPVAGSAITMVIEDSVIANIIGGSILSNIDGVLIEQETVAGLILNGTNLGNSLISTNCLSTIQSGTIVSSGDNAKITRFGVAGMLLFGDETSCTRCNTLTDISLATIQSTGYNTQIGPGTVVGIFSRDSNEDIVECNSVSKTSGGLVLIHGDCNTVLLPGQMPKSTIKNIPGGFTCFPDLAFYAAGIVSTAQETSIVASNTVHAISGGKLTIQSSGAQATTQGSIGIKVGFQTGDPLFGSVYNNTVDTISGPILTSQATGNSIQNIQGTVGITVSAFIGEVLSNTVQQITEGKVLVHAQSMISHFTNLKAIPQKTYDMDTLTTTHNPSAWFVPVITAGISIDGFEPPDTRRHVESTSGVPCIRVQDNTISDITGARIPGGQLPLGSIAVGIFAQPSATQLPIGSETIAQNICAHAQSEDITLGDITTNTIQNIVGGTKVPAYGIALDGSQLFLDTANSGSTPLPLSLCTIDNNLIKIITGNGSVRSFDITTQQLSALQNCCFDLFGTDGTECNLANSFIPLLPFEPTSGIYTLFGGCSQISNNTVTHINDTQTDARGITTAASSDMDIFDNILSQINGYGIFVGGAVIDNALLAQSEFTVEELSSIRNIIYNNSTVHNTNKGIELGVIDWNYFIIARDVLNACKNRPVRVHQTISDTSTGIVGNHGQVAPCIKKVICNSNGTITIEITLTDTLPSTHFIIQFFRNSTNSIPHGEQHISMFDDPQLVFQTNSNGNARAKFTFLPLVPIEPGDSISAHVTVQNNPSSETDDAFFGDTSEFSSKTPHNKPGFANLCHRTPEQCEPIA